MQRYLSTYKDRPFPENSDEMVEWLGELGIEMQAKGPAEKRTDKLVQTGHMSTFSPSKPKPNSHEPNKPQQELHIAYDQISCIIPLSAEKIFAATGKRGETINQNQVMNYYAASEVSSPNRSHMKLVV